MSDMDEAERALLVALGLLPAEPEPDATEESESVDFDGGPRETEPLQSDPVREHDQWIAEMLQDLPFGGGGQL